MPMGRHLRVERLVQPLDVVLLHERVESRVPTIGG
jgi:hypothetical protein